MFLNVLAVISGVSCMMGDIIITDDDQISLSVEVEGSAAIERIDIFDRLDHVEVIRPWSLGASADRLRITCAGQH
jgi:hypothetical protein